MFAVVKTPKTIGDPIQYNEKKVGEKKAFLLDAHNFWQDKSALAGREKLERFVAVMELNARPKKKVVHISLNFAPEEKVSDRLMKDIAKDFMLGIGYAEQPWLVYRHVDAGHPHLHIVSTNIRPDGSRILNDLRSPNRLRELNYAIEEKYALVHADPATELSQRQPVVGRTQHPEGETRVNYGKASTKREVVRVLDHVVNHYAFTSLESLNAVLGQFRVRADRGKEGSAMYNNRGLYYWVIDEKRKSLGPPIKASALPLPVTLPKLEEKFRANEAKLRERAQLLRSGIEWGLAQGAANLAAFKENMRRDGIAVVGDDRGLFYIDHRSGTVASDKELGEQYTAAAMMNKMPELGQEQEFGIHRDRGLDLSR